MGSDDLRSLLDERLLVERARRDPRAFSLLCRAYIDRVHACAYRRTGSYESAEQVARAAFERAWLALPGLVDTHSSFEPWLFRIVANELITHERRRRSDTDERSARILRELEEDLLADSVLSDALRPDDAERRNAELRDALAAATPRDQETLTLRFLSELDARGTATAMGCSRAALAVAERRALRSLTVASPRQALSELGAAPGPTPRAVFVAALNERLLELMGEVEDGDLVPEIELTLRTYRPRAARRIVAAVAAMAVMLAGSVAAVVAVTTGGRTAPATVAGAGAIADTGTDTDAGTPAPGDRDPLSAAGSRPAVPIARGALRAVAAPPGAPTPLARRVVPPVAAPVATMPLQVSGADGWSLVSWEPYAGDGFGGYLVVRSDGAGQPEYELAKVSTQESVSFHDTAPGSRDVRYRVIVLDDGGSELARSESMPVSPVTP
ncbi:MAG TPA: RNA polymerase sigma factor [Acidimicrobiales bacterium]